MDVVEATGGAIGVLSWVLSDSKKAIERNTILKARLLMHAMTLRRSCTMKWRTLHAM